jgi:GntR family transcriptional regulator, transcriptional repressor for pyruvate dehydrogenase complex
MPYSIYRIGKKELTKLNSPAAIEKLTQNPRLVSNAAEELRELILERPTGSYLGSMKDVAEKLGVGIVTVQQATRILEYEGLLTVKRGPGGGYYGNRPDHAALERTFATYMRVHDIGYREAFEMTVSLDCDLAEAAAASDDDSLPAKIAQLTEKLNACETAGDCIEFEVDFRDTLFSFANKPLLQLMASVAMQLFKAKSSAAGFGAGFSFTQWRHGRRQLLDAIARRDTELAYFEAQRYRRLVRRWMATV